jgi:signal peptidase II|tara:strand:- start:22 stop:510 length:489 start_codon:yes stop_codon:yes gene_type:complete
MIKKNLKIFLLNSLVVVTVFLVDRITKIYIIKLAEVSNNFDIYVTSYLNFYLVWNQGISFGLFSTNESYAYGILSLIISIIIIIVLIMIIKESNNFKKYSLLLVLGGALGNLFDRVIYYAVPDFIDFHIQNFHWFIFNVADIFISIGVICLIFAEIFFKDKD